VRPYRRLLLLLILVAAAVAAVDYAAAPTAKKYLLAEAERATGLKPSVGRVSLSLWRGSATAHDVVLPNPKPFRAPTILEARSVTVNVALLPLLKKSIVVQKLSLRGATITVERDARERTNLDAIRERLQARNGAKGRHRLRVDKFTLADSTIWYLDRDNGEETKSLALEDVEALVRDIDPARAGDPLPSRFSVDAAVATPRRGRLVAEGRTNPFQPAANFDLTLTLEGLDLPVLQRLYPASPVVIREGLADLYTSAVCRKYLLEARNRLVLHRLDFQPRGQASQVAGLPIQTVLAFLQREDRVDLTFDVTGDVRDPKADLKPAVERYVARALRDRVLGAPEKLYEAGQKSISVSVRVVKAGRRAGEVAVEKAKSLKEGLRQLIGR
jgi:hypothetical protein